MQTGRRARRNGIVSSGLCGAFTDTRNCSGPRLCSHTHFNSLRWLLENVPPGPTATTNTTYLRMRLQGPTGQRRSRIPPRAFIPPANREQVPREGAAEGGGAEGKPDAGHADGLVNATLLHSYARPRDRARRLLSQRLVQ